MNYPASSASQRIHVLIVDDHPIVRESLVSAIGNAPDMAVVGDVGAAAEVYEACARQLPDVIILDVALSDTHGLELLQNLRTQYPSIQAVVFSMYDERAYAERAIRSGAVGYVMKSEPTAKVLKAVRSAYRGEYFLSKDILTRILASIASGTSRQNDFPYADLSDREMEVYQLLGQGLDVMAIAHQLNLSRKTVEAYRRRVKEKLQLDSINALLRHAIRWTHSQSETKR